ncbi:hypothetical protein [Microbacterium sp. 22242]
MNDRWKITLGTDIGWRVWDGDRVVAVFTNGADALAYLTLKSGNQQRAS